MYCKSGEQLYMTDLDVIGAVRSFSEETGQYTLIDETTAKVFTASAHKCTAIPSEPAPLGLASPPSVPAAAPTQEDPLLVEFDCRDLLDALVEESDTENSDEGIADGTVSEIAGRERDA